MSKILVLGGGIVGLSTAMMLARRGHDVTVFERDSKPLPASPEDAWQGWERRGVAQFRQPHPFRNLAGHGCPPFPAIPSGLIQERCKSLAGIVPKVNRDFVVPLELRWCLCQMCSYAGSLGILALQRF